MGRRYLLIGTGAAAMAAAETIRDLDTEAAIVAIAGEASGYYSRPGLAYYLAKEVPEKGLFPFSAADIARLDVSVVHASAAGIDRARHAVVLEDGTELPYDRLLIATGSSAIPLRVPGAELDGVVKLDDMDDARDLIRRSRRAKSAVVVGGGVTALEIVEGLRERGVHVHYLMRKDRYWSNVLSEAESHIVERGLQSRGVEIHYFTELAAIVAREGSVSAIQTGDGTLIPCDMVAVAIGVLPRKELAEKAGITCGRGVLVDQFLCSSDPDIFAAGDVAEVCEDSTDRRTVEVLWSSAVAKGRVAAHNMVEASSRSYGDAAPLNVTRLAGSKITIIGTVGNGADSDLEGIARGDSETWRELGDAVTVESQDGVAHVRLALRTGTIAGAVVMGDQTLSFPLQELISGRADVRDVGAQLQVPGAPVADIVHAFWREWVTQRA